MTTCSIFPLGCVTYFVQEIAALSVFRQQAQVINFRFFSQLHAAHRLDCFHQITDTTFHRSRIKFAIQVLERGNRLRRGTTLCCALVSPRPFILEPGGQKQKGGSATKLDFSWPPVTQLE